MAPTAIRPPLQARDAYRYRHHGLTVASNEPIPRLEEAPQRPVDIVVEVTAPGTLPLVGLAWARPDPHRAFWRAQTARGSLLRLRYANDGASAEFVIDEVGATVWASLSAGVLIAEAAELLFGPVFSCILGQRGTTCLHAAVVAVGDRVIGLVGSKGSGKSTTSLALIRHGASLISDDVAALAEVDARPAVSFGAPRLRVTPDTADELCGSFDTLEPMWVHEDARPAKRYVELPYEPAAARDSPVGLDAVYFLAARHAPNKAPSVEILSAAQTLARLMANRHMMEVLGCDGHERDFKMLARIAEQIPAREVRRPDGLHATDATVNAILADVGTIP